MAERIRIVHVINSFEFGGAEAMLCNLLLRTDLRRFDPTVVALIDDLSVAGPILSAGIRVTTMGMRAGVPDPRGVARLARHLAQTRPDIVQTWMDHSNLVGGLAARISCRAKVVWGIHHSNHVRGLSKRSTLITVGACAKLSHLLPSRIVFCSQLARRLYAERGFSRSRMVVIPNGFDTSAFRPDASARMGVRQELGLDPDVILVGLVARYDPLKDHQTFLRAAAVVKGRFPQARFVLCGDKVNGNNTVLAAEMKSLGIDTHCHLLGARRDVSRLHAALDVAVSSSIAEAFPLVVGEAMSCGVPCVVTDVGDSALMVGATGRVVPPRDFLALGNSICDLIAMGGARAALGMQARDRVRELYDLGNVTRRYEALYEELAGDRTASAAAARRGVSREHLPASVALAIPS